MATTGRSRFLDHQRASLGIAGQVIRDQRSHCYRLVTTGDQGQDLGERWRDALHALQAIAKPTTTRRS